MGKQEDAAARRAAFYGKRGKSPAAGSDHESASVEGNEPAHSFTEEGSPDPEEGAQRESQAPWDPYQE
jgi:hypothetical protein